MASLLFLNYSWLGFFLVVFFLPIDRSFPSVCTEFLLGRKPHSLFKGRITSLPLTFLSPPLVYNFLGQPHYVPWEYGSFPPRASPFPLQSYSALLFVYRYCSYIFHTHPSFFPTSLYPSVTFRGVYRFLLPFFPRELFANYPSDPRLYFILLPPFAPS